jgi:hypothetical protein
MGRLSLPDVTLCAATSVNLAATLAALRRCLDQCEFGRALLFTDLTVTEAPDGLRVVQIPPLTSLQAYSHFVMSDLAAHIDTSHCLIVQWDGYILRPEAWDPTFLNFDYIGAVWPQFDDGAIIGNGGFSLRSKRLLEASAAISPANEQPEDVTICRTHRSQLEEEFGIRFADPLTAARFSFERTPSTGAEFGYHGVFNMPANLTGDEWWQVYLGLDDSGSVFHDLWKMIAATWNGSRSFERIVKLAWDATLARLGVNR